MKEIRNGEGFVKDTANINTESGKIASRYLIELEIRGKVGGEMENTRVEKPCYSDAKN